MYTFIQKLGIYGFKKEIYAHMAVKSVIHRSSYILLYKYFYLVPKTS